MHHAHLESLAHEFPSAELAIAEMAGLRARLTLPKGTIHVISDVHGEHAKLRHVINNASGALRPLVEELTRGRLSPQAQREFLAVIYYPREVMRSMRARLADPCARSRWVLGTLRLQLALVRRLEGTRRRKDLDDLLPPQHRELFTELFDDAQAGATETAPSGRTAYIDEMLRTLAEHDRDLAAVRAASRLVRNLSASEIVVAGDLGDRGPRIDRVIDILTRQPRVGLVWGNHDTTWMGSCLGHDACILTVLRFSARYRRASQLEEGYGILTTPLEKLVRDVYADDPCEHFMPKGTGLREALTVARMQKAIAVMQFKAEGQLIARHPEWNLDARRLLHKITFTGTAAARRAVSVEIDGKAHPMQDGFLPTIDPADPYAYSPGEAECMNRIRQSFTGSARLWEHMNWVCRKGRMWTARDDCLIFHACVPVDDAGKPLSLRVDGRDLAGRELMDALDAVVRRAFRKGADGLDADADWLWYMWGGPRSPLFGKDKLATFEGYFVADKHAREEHKNPYFTLAHDAAFIRSIGALFGKGPDVLIVNGHVPVKVEKGEQPVKRGGNAVTIDGAFSEAYGDRGYTLVLAPDRIALAEHAPFESVAAVVESGADIVPTVSTIRAYAKPHTVADTEEGQRIRARVDALKALVHAYEAGEMEEGG